MAGWMRGLGFGFRSIWGSVVLGLLALTLASNLLLFTSATALGFASAAAASLGWRTPYAALRAENAALQDRVAALRRDLDARATKVRELESDIERKDKRLTAQALTIREKDDLVRAQGARLQSSSNLIDRQKTEIAQRRTELRETRERVAQRADDLAARVERLAGRRLGAVLVKSIPVAGTVAVVGLTAYELDQDCELLRGIADLREQVGGDATVEEAVATVCGYSVPSADEVYAHVLAAPGEVWRSASDQFPQLPAWDPGALVPDISEYGWVNWIGDFFASSEPAVAE